MTTGAQYLALLRGINVGGGNVIRMAELKACFEKARLRNVATYIQSGNVMFDTAESDRRRLVMKLERALSRTFSPYKARALVYSHAHLTRIVHDAPNGFGSRPQEYRYDVIFLKDPLTTAEALLSVSLKGGVDEVFTGPGVLYFSRLDVMAAQSHLSRVVRLPVYQDMTIRNWNTTTRLLALMDARAG